MLDKIRDAYALLLWRRVHMSSRVALERWQLKKLRALVRLAAAESELYRSLWRARGVGTNTISSTKDLLRFPQVSKDDFRRRSVEEYICPGADQGYGWRITSGTSGEPFMFASINDVQSLGFGFISYRPIFWGGSSLGEIRKMKKVFLYSKARSVWQTASHILPIDPAEVAKNPESALRKILDFKPIILESHPSFLLDLPKMVRRYPMLWGNSLKYVFTIGEVLTQGQRKDIEDATGCEVFDRYGMTEFGTIASECKVHDGYHINSESFIVEVVGDNGDVIKKGEEGSVLVTDLRNKVVPYIRYRTGDRGRFLSKPCPCGVPSDRLVIVGRTAEFLKLNDGRTINNWDFFDILKPYQGVILRYQIVCTKEGTVVLNIIAPLGLDRASRVHIESEFRAILGSEHDFRIDIVPEIIKTKRGKAKTIVDLRD
jgi:phenylacetate-CoA ligase